MPKLKTHKGAAKRFRLTATGKIKRGHSHARHILTKKTNKRKRYLDVDVLVSDSDLVASDECCRTEEIKRVAQTSVCELAWRMHRLKSVPQ